MDLDTQEKCTSLVQVRLAQEWLDVLGCLQAVVGVGMGQLIGEALANSAPWWFREVRNRIRAGDVPGDLDLSALTEVLSRENRRELDAVREKVRRKGLQV